MFYFFAGIIIDAAAYPPEIADGADIVPTRHDPFKAVGQAGFAIGKIPLGKGLFHDGISHIFGGARGHRGFDQYHALGLDFFTDDLEAFFQGRNVGVSLTHIAQGLLVVVALDIYHHHIGQCQGLVSIGGCQGLFVHDASPDQRRHFRVFGFHRGDTPVQIGNLPETAGRWSLHTDNKIGALVALPVH